MHTHDWILKTSSSTGSGLIEHCNFTLYIEHYTVNNKKNTIIFKYQRSHSTISFSTKLVF